MAKLNGWLIVGAFTVALFSFSASSPAGATPRPHHCAHRLHCPKPHRCAHRRHCSKTHRCAHRRHRPKTHRCAQQRHDTKTHRTAQRRHHPKPSSPTGSSPTGSSPTGSSPTGSSPTGSSPTGSSPTGSSPTGSSPTGSSPTGSSPTGSSPPSSPGSQPMGDPQGKTWTLAFDDEFNGTSIDTTKWDVFNGVHPNNDVTSAAADCSESGGYLHLDVPGNGTGCNVSSAYEPYTGAATGANAWELAIGDYVEARVWFASSSQSPYDPIANWPAFWTSGVNWPDQWGDRHRRGLGEAHLQLSRTHGNDQSRLHAHAHHRLGRQLACVRRLSNRDRRIRVLGRKSRSDGPNNGRRRPPGDPFQHRHLRRNPELRVRLRRRHAGRLGTRLDKQLSSPRACPRKPR